MEKDQSESWRDYSYLRILAVDDNIENEELVSAMLEVFGCKADFALNGEEALKKVREAAIPYDLILMDLMMPVMDGFEATQELRRNPQYGRYQPRIVAVTAHTAEEVRMRCMENGFDDFISKPLTLLAIEKVLDDTDRRLRELAAARKRPKF